MSKNTLAKINFTKFFKNRSLDVCKTVFGVHFKTEDELWNHFREAMKKLAARCRRVRHARKIRTVGSSFIALPPSSNEPPPQPLHTPHPFTPMSTSTQASSPTPTSSMSSLVSVTNGLVNGVKVECSNGEMQDQAQP